MTAADLPTRRVELARRVSMSAAAVHGMRLRPPGSEWLFAKLYCARSADDDLIAAEVRPFLEQMLSAHPSDEWFFVRYADDGGSHIRVRVRGTPERLVGEVLPAMCEWGRRLMEEDVCTRFVFDTYEREIERYGGPAGLDVAESIFSADSRAAASILDLVTRRILQLDRTTLAVISIDDLLASFGLDENGRLDWCGGHAVARHAVGRDYRTRKVQLRALLSNPESVSAEKGGEALLHVFAERRAAIFPLADRLRELAKRDTLDESLPVIFGSFVHLHCNRLLGTDRAAEPRLLGLLLRTREGLARTRNAARKEFAFSKTQ